jgi:hypothetical protein
VHGISIGKLTKFKAYPVDSLIAELGHVTATLPSDWLVLEVQPPHWPITCVAIFAGSTEVAHDKISSQENILFRAEVETCNSVGLCDSDSV